MIYLDKTAQEITEKYGLIPSRETCSGCERSIILDVPIIIKGYIGFEMRKHGCDDKLLAACFTPVEQEEKDFWNTII